MKKINQFMAVGFISLISATAFACPKGTTLTGGTGPNHKGGKCVAIASSKTPSTKESKATKAATTESKAKEIKAQAPESKSKTDTKTPVKP